MAFLPSPALKSSFPAVHNNFLQKSTLNFLSHLPVQLLYTWTCWSHHLIIPSPSPTTLLLCPLPPCCTPITSSHIYSFFSSAITTLPCLEGCSPSTWSFVLWCHLDEPADLYVPSNLDHSVKTTVLLNTQHKSYEGNYAHLRKRLEIIQKIMNLKFSLQNYC